MVTASQFTATFTGRGGSRAISGYIADVVNTLTPLSLVGLAGTGSDKFYTAQADGYLSRISITTGPTVMKALSLMINGVPQGQIFDIVAFVSSAANPPALAIPIRRGDKVQFMEV